jgi:uncharacterized protein YbjT (DUF2867 family)
MKVLVIGGTGTVGSAVARELKARDVEVFILTRNADKAESLPAGMTAVVGDTFSPASARSIFQGMDGVFMANAASPSESNEALMSVCGAKEAGVKRFVYLSIHNVENGAYLPHFGSKLGVEAGLAASGMEWTSLRPNNFHQNDYWYQEALLKYGVYPQPLGSAGLHRVDVRDIGEAGAIALTTGKYGGQFIDLVGPTAVTGPQCAEFWSAALGRPIAYGGEEMNAWEEQTLTYLPGWLTYDFRLMYEFFQREGLLATPEAIDRLTTLLGHPPRSYEAFVNETAAAWTTLG